uniref:Uncharacterized protein n=1 Tax=Trypanosoma congolense (strain IL3000) TaxID=1068625 RepID=G0USU2_TRYCI|nr:conserved hypothetical protein [Trypanosoma congolense IL3000]
MPKCDTTVINDIQLQAAQLFVEPQTLLDVMLKQFHTVKRSQTDPFVSRVVIAGEVNEVIPCEFMKIIQETIDTSLCKRENPLSEPGCTSVLPSGVFIDYETCFIGLFEALDRHVIDFLTQLKTVSNSTGSVFLNVRILFLTDDVIPSATPCVGFLSKAPGMAAEGGTQDASEESIADMVVKDVSNLSKILSLASSENVIRRKAFLDNVRITHPSLLPSAACIYLYVKNEIFFTLDEYLQVFDKLPELTRDYEINHPVDQPLKY